MSTFQCMMFNTDQIALFSICYLSVPYRYAMLLIPMYFHFKIMQPFLLLFIFETVTEVSNEYIFATGTNIANLFEQILHLMDAAYI